MNNTATPTRIELPALSPRVTAALADAFPTLLAAAVFTILLVSFQPFAAGSITVTAATSSGNKLNQIGYSLLAVIMVAALFTIADPRRLLRMPAWSWLASIAALGFAVVNSPSPSIAMRVALFSIAAALTMVGVVALLRSERAMQSAFAAAALTVLGLSYFGVVFMPGVARHSVEIFEPLNEGLWRGIYQHKNTAGPVMAAFIFGGVHMMRSGRAWLGLAITVLATIFLIGSGSKTSGGTVFLVLFIVLLPSMAGLRGVAVAFSILVFGVFAVFTNGAVISEAVGDFITDISPENTYTGRIDLWAYAWEMIQRAPLRGYGFESLWGTPEVLEMERPFEASWDFRGIVHGHSSYFDTLLITGIPGGLAIFWVVLVQPLIDYMRCRRFRANIIAADLFLMIVLFTALNAFMETFFFRRGDPVWMLMVFGLAGLRLVATEQLARR